MYLICVAIQCKSWELFHGLAELVDALGCQPSESNLVWVRFPHPAQSPSRNRGVLGFYELYIVI